MADNKDKAEVSADEQMMRRPGAVNVDKSIRTASFDVNPNKWVQKAILSSVTSEMLEGDDDPDVKYPTLTFVFRGEEYMTMGDDPHVPMFVHREWAVLKPTKKGHSIEKQCEWQDQRIAQLFDVFMGAGAHKKLNGGKGIGAVEVMTWPNFFDSVANSFNAARNTKPVFQTAEGKNIPVYLKLTYGDNGRLQIPFGNFIDTFKEGRAHLLRKEKDDRFERPATPGSRRAAVGGSAGGGSDVGMPPTDLPDGFN